jgi:cytochrome b6-f complex iron-sulfur subunit
MANSALNTTGGYVYNQGIIIARTGTDTFAAVSAACTHQGTTLIYQSNGNRFHCNNHGSNFSTDGNVINGPAAAPLTAYKTQLTGNSLHITS